MSFLDHLNESVINIEDLFEAVEYALVEDLLDESVEHFKDLPNAWKKIVATKYGRRAGENSEVVIKSTGDIKNKSAFNKIFKQSLKDTSEAAGVIVEVEGVAAFAIINNYDKKFSIVFDDGNMKKIGRSRWDRGSRWSAGRYIKWTDSTLGVQETIDAIEQILIDAVISKINGSIEDEDKKVKTANMNDVFGNLHIAVKVIMPDEKRKEKSASRIEARGDSTESLKANRRRVIKKYTKTHIESFIKDLKNDIPKIDDVEELLLKAAEGETVEFNVKDLQKRLDNLNYVLRRFTSAYKSGKIKDNWKGELDWDMQYLKDAIDRLHGKND